jgi:hypothetical protein
MLLALNSFRYPHLKILNLSNNKIKCLKIRYLSMFKSLKIIHLDHNPLS